MTKPPKPRRIIAVADANAMAQLAAERVIARLQGPQDRFAVCLTGGSSPKRMYELLAADAYASRIPWPRVHWFIGDERFVPDGDERYNMTMARDAFLTRRAPPQNVHPIRTDVASPDAAARLYQDQLMAHYGSGILVPARPLFDIVLLGMGPDGHTASIFPDHPAALELQRWVVGVPEANVKPFVPRVTLTFEPLGSTPEILFQISGADKRPTLTRVLDGERLPAALAHATGETVWLCDRAALPENYRD